jgi:hypothetical protein
LDWLDYCGPPKLFLTRVTAEEEAKALRKQYGKRDGDYPGEKVAIVKVAPVP